ncbi:LysR family transcriptional regulator [Paraburkholderia sediminicola]|uniref:LysR family transcriptional regulator n=1 Tax=Paraburkholderia rhynchosiae TaxID=487049 RepID=A0ACC7N771_9BURK
MSDILDGVTTFVRVVETGSFALAAERMNLTRSAVGKVIVRLEKRLGVRLIDRTTRSQSLTEDGQAYYDRCVRALAGFGLPWLPSWLLTRYAQSGELVTVMDDCFRSSEEIHVMWPKSRYLALKTRCAIDALVAEIPAMIDQGAQPGVPRSRATRNT